jgi:integrase/recombinase XerD
VRVGSGRLRVIAGEVVAGPEAIDPEQFQAECVEAFVASWTARGFASSTIDNDVGVLGRMLEALGRPAWEVTADDVDRVVGALACAGRAVSTRRNYLQVFKGFHRFLEVRKAAEIEAVFGVRLVCPLDEFNAARHVGEDSSAVDPPPLPERVSGFFDFLKGRIATGRKYGPAARDYALFRTLYHAGVRTEEVVMLDKPDVQFGRGPSGKLHVRFGKGAKTSGPRPRWVPMLDNLDLVLRWFLDDVRGRFPASPVLFCDESGGRMAAGTIRNRLRHLMNLEGRPSSEWFTPARIAQGMRDPQLRARSGPGSDPAAARALDGELDDAVCPPTLGNCTRRARNRRSPGQRGA